MHNLTFQDILHVFQLLVDEHLSGGDGAVQGTQLSYISCRTGHHLTVMDTIQQDSLSRFEGFFLFPLIDVMI
jgi:hypothetical protein